jgi:hypothetical protein
MNKEIFCFTTRVSFRLSDFAHSIRTFNNEGLFFPSIISSFVGTFRISMWVEEEAETIMSGTTEDLEEEEDLEAFHVPPSVLERFGLAILRCLPHGEGFQPFSLTDEELNVHVTWVLAQGLFLTAVISILDVLPVVEMEFSLKQQQWSILAITAMTGGLTAFLLPFEILLLFIVALYCSSSLGSFVMLHDEKLLGVFAPDRLLARASLELDDPVVILRHVNAFKSISRRNLLILGLLYKLKIVLSNVVLRFTAKVIFGNDFPFYIISFLVEIFWNCVVRGSFCFCLPFS